MEMCFQRDRKGGRDSFKEGKEQNENNKSSELNIEEQKKEKMEKVCFRGREKPRKRYI